MLLVNDNLPSSVVAQSDDSPSNLCDTDSTKKYALASLYPGGSCVVVMALPGRNPYVPSISTLMLRPGYINIS